MDTGPESHSAPTNHLELLDIKLSTLVDAVCNIELENKVHHNMNQE